jgi:hypothetical protein
MNGQPIYLTNTVTDRPAPLGTGLPIDAGAHLITIQAPDLTTAVTSTTPTHDSTGKYHLDVASTSLPQNGHYQWTWQTTGVGSGMLRGEFDVFDPFEPQVLPLQDAKRATNTTNTTIYDDDLQTYVDTVVATLEYITGGPIYNRTITERVEATDSRTAIAIRKRPLVSITSITDVASGSTISLADIELDTIAGIVRRKRNQPWWGWGTNGYTVVYVAGQGTIIPAAFNTAAKIIIQHLWETQRGPGLSPMAGLEDTILPGMSFAIPNRALEILRPYTLEVYF